MTAARRGRDVIRFGIVSTILSVAIFFVVMLAAMPSRAQIFASYLCDDGTQVSAAFFPKEKNMRMQMAGRSYSLPQRLSADGGRYAKGRVSFWIKGQQATLKRPRVKATICRAQ
jgi:membrane-bound inhibitor of C-type lysozyme